MRDSRRDGVYLIQVAKGNLIMNSTYEVHTGDCLDYMLRQPVDKFDLCFGSPPYEDARTYGIGFNLKGQQWVDWMVERIIQMVRVTKGLVAMVVEGKTKNFRWSGTPALLQADLIRSGVTLRKPPIFHRVGIPGSGGPDWLRNDYEFIVCCTSGDKLPWSDNVAMGEPARWAPGGQMSYRNRDGRRKNNSAGPKAKARWNRNQWGGTGSTTERKKNGHRSKKVERPSHTKRKPNGEIENQSYNAPAIANPGNVIKCDVGGGHMGDKLCHENEAPFPEKLAEFFIRSFCPPDGTVFDPFCGSGTTLAVAKRFKRNTLGIDVRESQVNLTKRRCKEVQLEMFS